MARLWEWVHRAASVAQLWPWLGGSAVGAVLTYIWTFFSTLPLPILFALSMFIVLCGVWVANGIVQFRDVRHARKGLPPGTRMLTRKDLEKANPKRENLKELGWADDPPQLEKIGELHNSIIASMGSHLFEFGHGAWEYYDRQDNNDKRRIRKYMLAEARWWYGKGDLIRAVGGKDRPQFPRSLPPPVEVTEGPRHVYLTEADLSATADISGLVSDLYWYPEDRYYLFFKHGDGVGARLTKQLELQGVGMPKTELYFYQHPNPAYPNDFVRVLPGGGDFEWQRKAAEGEMYGRVTLVLEPWRRRELDIAETARATTHAIASNEPFVEVRPNFYGIGVNLNSLVRQVFSWLKRHGPFVVGSLLLLAACAGPTYWTKPDFTQARFNIDDYECRQQARTAYHIFTPVGRSVLALPMTSVDEGLYDRCMYARGYYLIDAQGQRVQ